MRKMNENQLKNLEGGKFWGTSCGECITYASGGRFRDCVKRIFWIRVRASLDRC